MRKVRDIGGQDRSSADGTTILSIYQVLYKYKPISLATSTALALPSFLGSSRPKMLLIPIRVGEQCRLPFALCAKRDVVCVGCFP